MEANYLELINHKIIWPDQLDRLLSLWRFKDEKIVFTNGCFDIVHRGHVEYLAKASTLGTKLIIGLNTDRSVKKLKGENRPVNPEEARAMILASFMFVDVIVYFSDDTPYSLISSIRPDVLVKGGDYIIEEIVGFDVVTKHGGKVVTIPFVDGYSSTSVIKKAGLM